MMDMQHEPIQANAPDSYTVLVRSRSSGRVLTVSEWEVEIPPEGDLESVAMMTAARLVGEMGEGDVSVCIRLHRA